MCNKFKNNKNVEIINGVPVDWSLYKGKDNDRSKKGYIGLCRLLYNKNHKLFSEYINAKTKVLIDFNCGHEAHWIKPYGYKSGRGCPKCSNRCLEQAKEEIFNMLEKNDHKLLSEYVNAKTKILIDFKCGHNAHWIAPDNYKKGVSCPKCSGKCPQQAKEEIFNMLEKNDHKLLSEYVNTKTKILIDFKCGHEPHWIKPDSYKNGIGCPFCKNKGESALYELLLDMGYEVEIQKKYEDLKDRRLLPYDFYLPKYNLLIELDGEHHRKPVPYYSKDMTQQEKDMAELDALISFNDRKEKDKLKTEYAKNNDIYLLRIDYYDSKIESDKWKELILNKIKEIEIKKELMFFQNNLNKSKISIAN